MSKSFVLFSVALSGLVLVGCNKDENPKPVEVPATTAPSTTGPALPTLPTLPTSLPTTGAVGEAIDSGKAAASGVEKKAGDAISGIKVPTSLPSDATK